MALVRVYYTDSMSAEQFEKALTCRRCRGIGSEPYAEEQPCPSCDGDGFSRDNGWTYAVPDEWDVRVGDRIVVPPTPRTDGDQVVTVVGLDSTFRMSTKIKYAVRKL